MYFILWIIIGGICAAICSSMARSRGRGSGLWAVLGFFLGLLAILILAVMGNTNEQLMLGSASRGEEIVAEGSKPTESPPDFRRVANS